MSKEMSEEAEAEELAAIKKAARDNKEKKQEEEKARKKKLASAFAFGAEEEDEDSKRDLEIAAAAAAKRAANKRRSAAPEAMPAALAVSAPPRGKAHHEMDMYQALKKIADFKRSCNGAARPIPKELQELALQMSGSGGSPR